MTLVDARDPDAYFAALNQRRSGVRPRDGLTPAELLALATANPADPVTRGRLLALQRTMAGRPEAQMATELLALGQSPTVTPPPAHRNPMDLQGRRIAPRPLVDSDLRFLDSLRGRSPATISHADAEIVAELDAIATTSTERRLVSEVADGLRRYHDRLAEETALRARVAAAAATPREQRHAVERVVLPVLSDRLAEQETARVARELRDVEPAVRERVAADAATLAHHEALRILAEALDGAEAERAAARDEAQARLNALALGADPVSTRPAPSATSALDAGRQRAEADRGSVPTAAQLREDFRSPAGPALGALEAAGRVERVELDEGGEP